MPQAQEFFQFDLIRLRMKPLSKLQAFFRNLSLSRHHRNRDLIIGPLLHHLMMQYESMLVFNTHTRPSSTEHRLCLC